MKKFIIYKPSGKLETISADRVEWKKSQGGLLVKFFIGRKVTVKFQDAILLIEDSPAIISIPARNEIQDDD